MEKTFCNQCQCQHYLSKLTIDEREGICYPSKEDVAEWYEGPKGPKDYPPRWCWHFNFGRK